MSSAAALAITAFAGVVWAQPSELRGRVVSIADRDPVTVLDADRADKC